MISTILHLIHVSAWAGIAAVGFGVLFNVPKKAIVTIFSLGFGAGLIKFALMNFDVNIILSSFIAALFVGLLSMPIAHKIHHPPVIFSIPPIIPMIPGYFAYETVLYVIKFTFLVNDTTNKMELIEGIFINGFTMFFILVSITVGVAFPMLLLRKSTVKRLNS